MDQSALRIEKRDKDTGTLISGTAGTEFEGGFIQSDLSTGYEVGASIAHDADSFCVVGNDKPTVVLGPYDSEWRIERRDKLTGAFLNP
jgi:hypothetical protein